MDDLEGLIRPLTPTATRPLLGCTILVVEDSRFACEAMRLLCLRSGARLRRADCLSAAHKHLRVYNPTVVIADLGLPDGCGIDLIRDLAGATPRPAVVLGMSGDPARNGDVLNAGGDGFLAKPIQSLATFQNLVLAHLPKEMRPKSIGLVRNDHIKPDAIAFQDDIAHVCEVLDTRADDRALDYVAQFTSGVARCVNDGALMAAAEALARQRAKGGSTRRDLTRLSGMLQDRLRARAAI